MNDSCDAAVFAVLLGYSALGRAQRALFLEHLNEFQYVSPQQQRRIALGWLSTCQESPQPTARMIAESAAAYFAEGKKPRKGDKK